MIEAILLTDMALHGKVFASAKDLVARNAAAIAHAQHSTAAAAAAVPDALSAALRNSSSSSTATTAATAAAATAETNGRSSSDVTGDVHGDVAAAVLTLSAEDERAMLACLLHAADLSSPGRPWNVSKQWVDRLWEVRCYYYTITLFILLYHILIVVVVAYHAGVRVAAVVNMYTVTRLLSTRSDTKVDCTSSSVRYAQFWCKCSHLALQCSSMQLSSEVPLTCDTTTAVC